jgi:tetratricopeptide (TPR) repeat protein
MSRILPIPLCVSLLAAIFCAPSSPAAEPLWLEIHSTHFTVITDAGDKKGREVALRFEQMRAVFANLLTKDRLHESRPLTILAFKNDESYYRLAPLHQGQPIDAPGFLLSGEDQDFIALNVFEEEPWRAVAHDFAIRLLNFNYPPAQGWFDEGLAEYFSSIRVDNKDVEIGGDPELQPSAKEDLLGNQRDTHPAKSLTELLAAQVWLSLPDLFTMKHDPSRNEGTRHTLYYAESWMVMHYLLHEKKLPETGAYFGLVLNQHVPVEDAIQQAYGMNSAQLEKAVKDYFHAQSGLQAAVDDARRTNSDPGQPSSVVRSGSTERFPVPVGQEDSAVISKPFPEPDARALYAAVQLRIPERREFGLKTLNDLATTPTEADKKAESKPTKRTGEDAEQLPSNAIGNPVAHRFLAWDNIEHNKFEEAFAEIGDAASLNPRDMWVRYYLSLAKYRLAQAKHADMMGLANMMLDLKAVLEWNPELADAYDLLAVARNSGGSTSAALQAEREAMSLSPRNERYVFHLAEIYVSSKKWEAAGSLLDRLKSSSDPQIASQARELLNQAGAERKYGVAATSTGTRQSKYEAQKTPFDVLEEDAAKRETAENAPPSGSPGDRRTTKFVKGRLVAVDCSNAPTAVLTVHSGQGTLRLRTADYKSLLLIGADDFSCEWRDRAITANYKSSGAGGGDLVSLEMR